MSAIPGPQFRYCDGLSRRNFLQIGAAGFAGLGLNDLLRAESQAGRGNRIASKAIINIHLGGGPPHLDMFDMKPDAPAEIRGEFRPIATNVAGIEMCELFPQLAMRTDRLAIIRSLVGSVGDHDFYQTGSGWGERDLRSAGGHPSLGAVASKFIGSRDGKAPAFVDFKSNGGPGFLGPVYGAYVPDGQGTANLRRHYTLTTKRLEDRVDLRRNFDRLNDQLDLNSSMASVDTFTQRAVDVLTSSKVGDALDLTREDPRLVAKYRGAERSDNDRARLMSGHNDYFLMARRLIEAGVRCVSMNWGGWDTHSDNFTTMKAQLPKLDIGLFCLIDDLTARGIFDDVMVVMWGEFGRSPRINNSNGGRDHWPQVGNALLFGGGLQGGQVIGATNRLGEFATERAVHFQEVFATFYHQLGIDPDLTQMVDRNGRPQYLLDHRTPVKELL
jgi:hypothetical protein